jgi:hypothetical protein
MIKKMSALSVVITMIFSLLVASGCKTDEKVKALEQCSKNLKPTTKEIELIKQYLDFEFEIIDSVKIDTPKPFVISILKSSETNIWAFRFDKTKIDRIYKSQNINERDLKFGFYDEWERKENCLWGKVLNGNILCPITIVSDFKGYLINYYIIKLLAINKDLDLIELETNWDEKIFNRSGDPFSKESVNFIIHPIFPENDSKTTNQTTSIVYEYTKENGIEIVDNQAIENGYYVEKMGKIFSLKDKNLITDELAIKIMRVYNNSILSWRQNEEKYKYELQLLLDQLDKKPGISDYIDRMNNQLGIFSHVVNRVTTDYVYDLPSIPIRWEISQIGSDDELVFSSRWLIKKTLYEKNHPLLPKDKVIINFKTYDSIEFSYVLVILEGDKPFEGGTCLYSELGNSLLCFIFKNNKLVKQEILLENSCSIEFTESNFYNRGDPYYNDYLDMNTWGMDFEGGKIFHFINSNSSGNCWGCATSYFLWVKDSEILNFNYQPYLDEYGSSLRGISVEDGKLVFYSVLWGYEYFQGQSKAGSPKIHLIYEFENGKLVNTTKKHLRFVESEIEGARSYTPVSAMAKISVLAREAGLLDKYWPLIEETARDSKDERVLRYFNNLKKEYNR